MDMPDASFLARMEDLESRLMQQELAIAELSDELYRQQRQVAQLEQTVLHLSARLQEVALPQATNDSPDEAPPHY